MRNAYILTVDKNSERAIFSSNLLNKIGFNVILFEAIKDSNPMVSHRKSMYAIYERIILEEKNKYCYVFEDDINTSLNINLDYIINYEELNEDIYYLGFCYNRGRFLKQNIEINGHTMFKIRGGIKGLHSLCLSKEGASKLKKLYDDNKNELHMDVLLQKYTKKNPLFVVRKDVVSPCNNTHYGIFYQDRHKFTSLLEKFY